MRILFVDDEKSLRDYVRTLIDWESSGYDFFEADNGKVAVELLQRIHIDLILLDITMPVMDGIQVLEWIKRNKYSCVTSILTSHDDFGYAQKALRIGCHDYILKTDLSVTNIQKVVHEMHLAASQEAQKAHELHVLETKVKRKELEEVREKIIYWLKEKKQEEFSYKHIPIHTSLVRINEKWGTKSNFAMMLIDIKNYEETITRFSKSDIIQFSIMFDNIIAELMGEVLFFYIEPSYGQILFYLRFDAYTAKEELLKIINEITEHIFHTFYERLGIVCSIIISKFFKQLEESRAIYKELQALHTMSYYQCEKVIYHAYEFQAITHMNEEMIQTILTNFKQALFEKQFLDAQKVYMDFVSTIYSFMLFVEPKDFQDRFILLVNEFLVAQDSKQRFKVQRVEDAKQFLEEMMQVLRPFQVDDKMQGKKAIVKKTILLIQQYYAQDIGLEWLADQLLINASYLSRIFSREVGQSLTNYMNEVRIEEAKKLMKTSNYKLYEIAEKVGYSSPIVFSNIFKKTVGMSPSEFKQKNI